MTHGMGAVENFSGGHACPGTVTPVRLDSIARRQQGVVTSAQAQTAGLTRSAIRARLRQDDWQELQRGVYLTHTGPVSDRAKAMAVLLKAGDPAALSHDSALWIWRVGERPETWTVAVPNSRRVLLPGARLVRVRRFEKRKVDGFAVTPLHRALVDLADEPGISVDEVIALTAAACQVRTTTGERVLAELADRRSHRLRRPLQLALGDVAEGIESLAEHLFLVRVVRDHELPAFVSQVDAEYGRADFRNDDYAVIVEIDGLAHHSGKKFRGDRLRDRRAGAVGMLTVRGTWWDVDDGPCEFAQDLGATLGTRGWSGYAVPCCDTCPVGLGSPRVS